MTLLLENRPEPVIRRSAGRLVSGVQASAVTRKPAWPLCQRGLTPLGDRGLTAAGDRHGGEGPAKASWFDRYVLVCQGASAVVLMIGSYVANSAADDDHGDTGARRQQGLEARL